VRFEGRAPEEKEIHDDAERSDVDLEGMAVLTDDDLRGDVVRCPADRIPSVGFILELRREPKVAELDLHVVVEEEVAELETI